MALDSKQKRGSAMLLGQSWRGWLAEPSGSVPVASRISLRWWCSAVPPGALNEHPGPWFQRAGQTWTPGVVSGELWTPGMVSGQTWIPGMVAGEVGQ